MAAARQRAFNGRSTASGSRNAAIAAVQINWKKMSPDGDRDERLEWISEYLGREVHSLTDLTDQQLGAVAGEMKRLTGTQAAVDSRQPQRVRTASDSDRVPGNVVDINANVHRANVNNENWSVSGEDPTTIHLASHEQIHTLGKLQEYLQWSEDSMAGFIRNHLRIASKASFRQLTFKQATKATMILLNIAGHRDLKKRNGGKPVSRAELNKYIPLLKAELRIDQRRD